MKCPVAVLSILVFIAVSCSTRDSHEYPPNILFIGVDDLNDWTEILDGHPQAITPNMDKLASEGISFTNAHANCAACQPSRNSLFSGLLPSTSGWYENTFGGGLKRPVYDYIQSLSVPLPQYFRENGYTTMGAGKLYHSGVSEYDEHIELLWDSAAPEYTISDYFVNEVGHGYAGSGHHYHPFPRGGSQIVRKYGEKVPGFSLCGGPLEREKDIPDGVMHDEYIAGWAVEQLQREHEKPFFLAVGFVRPHVPFTAPVEYFDLYPDSTIIIPEVPEDDLSDIPVYGKAMIPGILPSGDHYTVLDIRRIRKL